VELRIEEKECSTKEGTTEVEKETTFTDSELLLVEGRESDNQGRGGNPIKRGIHR